MKKKLFIFHVRNGDRNGIEVIPADTAKEAKRELESRDDIFGGDFEYQTFEWMEVRNIERILGIEALDRFKTAAALRYAVEEHGEDMTEAEEIILTNVAKKLEKFHLAALF